jgi:hypothetical protein
LHDTTEHGYLIAYRIPDYDDEGRAIGYHLGLQQLSEKFYPIGALLETTGLLLGAHDGKAFVFQRNKTGNQIKVYSYREQD